MNYVARVLVAIMSWVVVGSCAEAKEVTDFKLGIERLTPKLFESLCLPNTKKCTLGVITNQTGMCQVGKRNIDIILEQGVSIKYIFAPEHGFGGATPAGVSVADDIDVPTGIPVIGLYEKGHSVRIDASHIKEVDALVFDVQDCGMRYYSHIATLLRVMQGAADLHKPVIILDRPNPLGGIAEGPLAYDQIKKQYFMPDLLVAVSSIPMRHGLTIGELARYFNRWALAHPIDLHVVAMHNYRRTPGLAHVSAPLSPNIRTQQSCYGYSFMGLLGEVRPFDLGIGTDFAFQTIALPSDAGLADGQWRALSELLKKHHIDSWHFEYHSARKKKDMRGIRLLVTDIQKLCAFDLFIDIVTFFKNADIKLSFSCGFDTAVGTPLVRTLFMEKGVSEAVRHSLNASIDVGLKQFLVRAREIALYTPHPYLNNTSHTLLAKEPRHRIDNAINNTLN